MKKVNKLCCYSFFIIAVVVFLVQAIWILFDLNFGNKTIIGNGFICIISGIAVLTSITIYRKIPISFPLEKRANRFLLFSMSLFFLGDLNWLFQEVFEKVAVPIGGLSDILWFGAYICAIIAAISFSSIAFAPSRKRFYTMIALGVVIIGIIMYLNISQDISLGTFNFDHAIQDVYIFYDLILIVLISRLFIDLISIEKADMFYSWMILGVGIFTRAVYDYLFANLSETASYYTGHPIDLVYVFFYLMIILAGSTKLAFLRRRNND